MSFDEEEGEQILQLARDTIQHATDDHMTNAQLCYACVIILEHCQANMSEATRAYNDLRNTKQEMGTARKRSLDS